MPGLVPSFSVVVPTHDRPAPLRTCLAALGRLDYPLHRFEVVVVDDGSPSSLRPAVAPFRDVMDLTLVEQPRTGPATARNAGAARATGTFLAFTDDDCAPEAGWLRAFADRFAAEPGHLVGGRTVNALPDDPYATASQQLISYLYAYFDPKSHAPFFASNNIALPADRFCTLGGFSTDFPLAAGEDREFCSRWHRRGWPMSYAPGAVVRHAHALTLRRFWRQHFNYGRGAFFFHQKRAARRGSAGPAAGIRPTLEPLSFYWNLLCYPLRQKPGAFAFVQALSQMLLLGISQAANVSGFFYEYLRPALLHPLPSSGNREGEETCAS